MKKNKKQIPETFENLSDSKDVLNSKSGGSFVQNPNQNNQVHRESLGPNTKR